MDSEFSRERGATPVRAHHELPLPATPLPGRGNPRPFEIESETRQFYKSSAAVTHPFQLVDVSNGTDAPQVLVRPGMISSTWGWGSAPPTGMDLVDGQTFTITDTCYVLLKFEITGDETPSIADITIEIETSIPSDTGTVAYIAIGYLEVTPGTPDVIDSIFQNLQSNLIHELAFEGYSFPDFWRQLVGPISSAL